MWTLLCPDELMPKLLAPFAPTAPAEDEALLLAAADVLHLAVRAWTDYPALERAVKPWWSPLTTVLLTTTQHAPGDGAAGTDRPPAAASAWAVLSTLAQTYPAALVPHAGDVVKALSVSGLAFPVLNVRRGMRGRTGLSVECVVASAADNTGLATPGSCAWCSGASLRGGGRAIGAELAPPGRVRARGHHRAGARAGVHRSQRSGRGRAQPRAADSGAMGGIEPVVDMRGTVQMCCMQKCTGG